MLFSKLLLAALGGATAALSAHVSRCALNSNRNPAFLNDKSAKFQVNRTGVPGVDFDIGESYAGRLPIAGPKRSNSSSANELFFWFFPSRNPDAINEITVFLNGGPGCSSMAGLLQENGPFLWQPGTYSPQPNPFSWTNLTNMVWIDQPIGTGLSSADPGAGLNITNEHDVAVHFAGFWRNFIDTFDMYGYDVYLTGESYAGQMIPYIGDYFLKQSEHGSDNDYFNLKGIQLIDPAIGPLGVMEQAPAVQYLNARRSYFNLNDTFMEHINQEALYCGFTEYMDKALTFPPKGPIPLPLSMNATAGTLHDKCQPWVEIAEAALYVNPCFDPYHITNFCPFPSNQLGFPTLGWGPNNYFNRSDVQDALNIGEPRPNFMLCKETEFGLDDSEPSAFRMIPSIIERTGNVVIANGELDFLIMSNGTLAAINNMTWQGLQGFQESPFKGGDNFFVPYNPTIGPAIDATLSQRRIPSLSVGLVGGGGWYGKTHTERGLTFTTVALAGHEIPQYAPGAAYRLLEFTLGRVDNLTEVGEFTTVGNCVS
ncbi:hypothetical protein KVR01_008997 [Diaporthe batatas]|uniref:uncharacterized protein n=1 Tax=Diaporthe batatas TaxID=748121 RepID=UPI001D04FD44|nr:uncharacterized protein KVR01_008997 [Diaporthe batatas]KAG8160733.1 hypothetical protein KVR01_008997 [Diaporthe batatas]